jgi:hypothetical protein
MTLDAANFKFYASVSTLGGGINLSSPQTTGVVGNEFSTITNAERATGTIKYRKQFIKNENAEDWTSVKVFFKYKTTNAPNTEVLFAISGSKSMLTTASTLSGSATVTATGYFFTSVDLRGEVATGEMAYNAEDSLSKAVFIEEITSTYIRTRTPYTGATGESKQLMVAPATMANFIGPISKDDSTSPLIDLLAGGTVAIWKSYLVWNGCPAYSNDAFTLQFEGA